MTEHRERYEAGGPADVVGLQADITALAARLAELPPASQRAWLLALLMAVERRTGDVELWVSDVVSELQTDLAQREVLGTWPKSVKY